MMHLNIYQIIAVAFSLFFIVDRVLKYLRKEPGQTLFKLVTITGILLAITAIILYPSIIVSVNKKLGGDRNFNTLIFIVFILIFLAILKLLNIIERNERHITEIVRNQALTLLKTQRKIRHEK